VFFNLALTKYGEDNEAKMSHTPSFSFIFSFISLVCMSMFVADQALIV